MTYSIIMPLLRSLNEIISQRDDTFIEFVFDAMAMFCKPIRFSEPYRFEYGIHPAFNVPMGLK